MSKEDILNDLIDEVSDMFRDGEEMSNHDYKTGYIQALLNVISLLEYEKDC